MSKKMIESQKQMFLTFEGKDIRLRLAGWGEMTIDWDDGTIETHGLWNYNSEVDKCYNERYLFKHYYGCDYPRVITIAGECITHFGCEQNSITGLDVSKNNELIELHCVDNELTELDVSKNTELKKLYCDGNNLKSINVKGNTALEVLKCSHNKLTSLDVSNNLALIKLNCSWNSLKCLDVSNNLALVELYCCENRLKCLDVGANIALKELDFRYNQLTNLNITLENLCRFIGVNSITIKEPDLNCFVFYNDIRVDKNCPF